MFVKLKVKSIEIYFIAEILHLRAYKILQTSSE